MHKIFPNFQDKNLSPQLHVYVIIHFLSLYLLLHVDAPLSGAVVKHRNIY